MEFNPVYRILKFKLNVLNCKTCLAKSKEMKHNLKYVNLYVICLHVKFNCRNTTSFLGFSNFLDGTLQSSCILGSGTSAPIFIDNNVLFRKGLGILKSGHFILYMIFFIYLLIFAIVVNILRNIIFCSCFIAHVYYVVTSVITWL